MFAVANCLASTAAYCACSACQTVSRETLKRSARVGYCFLFFLGVVTSWLMRDFAKPLLEKIPWIMKSALDFQPSDKWFGQQAVYRISLGNWLFFMSMSLVLLGVRHKSDKRDSYLHHGNWLLKLGLWLVFTALPFFFPNSIILAYGWAARFGAGVFLVIQMIILLDFCLSWNESWAEAGEDDNRWYYALLAVTVGAYMGMLGVAGAMFYFFKPAGAGSCSGNVAVITLGLLVGVVFLLLSILPMGREGVLFPSSCISLYCMYLCASALQSEPKDYECNGLGRKVSAASASSLAVGMLVTLVAIVYSALRAGSNTSLFSLEKDAEEEGARPLLESADVETSAGLEGAPEQVATRDTPAAPAEELEAVTYNYSFFHLIFALASMYVAMLMTGWGEVEQEKDRVDVGWTSVGVKLAAGGATALLYCWYLVAPSVLPDRDFS